MFEQWNVIRAMRGLIPKKHGFELSNDLAHKEGMAKVVKARAVNRIQDKRSDERAKARLISLGGRGSEPALGIKLR